MNIIIVKYLEIVILIILSLMSDIETYKIKNIIVYPFIIIGIITNLYLDGIGGLFFSLKGVIIPIFLLNILFILRMLGAGDIKLFSAIGAIMGGKFVLYTILYSFLCGGFIALLLIIIRKNAMERFKELYIYLKNSFITSSILPYTDFKDKSDGGKFRFTMAVTCGICISLIQM